MNSFILEQGIAESIGKYLLLQNPTLHHVYRFFLLDTINTKPSGWVKPGQVIATGVERVYYDIITPSTPKLHLPTGDTTGVFINSKALHTELYRLEGTQ